MNIAVIGGGRVGLPVAAGFARLGYRTVCCERDGGRRGAIAAGKAPFADGGLDEAVSEGIASGALRVCGGVAQAAAEADAVFAAVPAGAGKNGLDELYAAAEAAAKSAPPHCVLAVKSTVPPGTCENIAGMMGRKMPVAYNPEFLRQGHGFADFLSPRRIVVGAADARASRVLRKIYAPLVARGVRYIETNFAGAEVAKLAANMFLSSRVALVNEVADLCHAAGCGVSEVAEILAADGRIGGGHLRAGIGFGGACLPKDGRLLAEAARRLRVEMPAAEALFASNARRAEKTAARILELLPQNAVAAVWGLAYKPGADDFRESPAVAITRALLAQKVRIRGYDPAANPDDLRHALPGADFFCGQMDALSGADMLVVAVAGETFAQTDARAIRRAMKGTAVFDCAGIFRRKTMQEAGLVLHSLF